MRKMRKTLKPEDVEYLYIARDEKHLDNNCIYFRVPRELAQQMFTRKRKALNADEKPDDSYIEGKLQFWFDPFRQSIDEILLAPVYGPTEDLGEPIEAEKYVGKTLLNYVDNLCFSEHKKHLSEVKTKPLTKHDVKYENILRTGRAFATFEFVSDGDVSVERGAEKLGMSVTDFIKAMQDNGFKVPDSADARKPI